MGDQGSAPPFYTAQPSVILEGQSNQELASALTSLLVEEATEGLFRCEVTFGNWGNTDDNVIDYLYFNRRVLDFGKSLAFVIGAEKTRAKIFEGRITCLEGHYMKGGNREILVLAEDRFQDLRMTRRTQTFENMSDRDVIKQIVTKHGLIVDIDVEGPNQRILAQVNQSDLSFIRDRARDIDAEIWIEGNTFHAKARNLRGTESVMLAYQEGLTEFSAIADLANQRTSLGVSGWDVASKEEINYEASESAISQEVNGKSGSSLLESAFGKRAEQIVHFAPSTLQEARFLAEAHYRKIARRFVTGYGIADGDGRIRVGVSVELKKLGTMFDGKYYVTEVRHTFDRKNGYRTYFAVERAWIR